MDLRKLDREREVWAAGRIAAELNRTQGFDYTAYPPMKCDAEDAVLVSQSRRNPSLTVEVVSVPIGEEIIRRDRKNLVTANEMLKSELQRLGIRHGDFLVNWAEGLARSRIQRVRIQELARLVASRSSKLHGQLTILAEEIYDEFPKLVSTFNYVRCLRMPPVTDIFVSNTTFCYLPRDGRWIQDAIAKKLNRVADLLVVDGGCYVDREQVDAFAAVFRPDTCPFKQLWIVNTHEVFRIKLSLEKPLSR
jgi:hypothetical protein